MSIIYKENMMDFYGFYTGKILTLINILVPMLKRKRRNFSYFCTFSLPHHPDRKFNDWQEWKMNKVSDGNFWECYVPTSKSRSDVQI